MHFNLALIQFIAEHRNPVLTHFFLYCSFLGDVNGYIFITTIIYVMYDKRLALRLAILVLATSGLNHFLKIIIKNPRPFVRQGTYLKEWAIPRADAASLASEYSTPSGHAMAAGAFYPYFCAFTSNRLVKILAIAALFCIGLSRPYLGVHYVEDILIGWTVGGLVAFGAYKYTMNIEEWWEKLQFKHQIIAIIAAGLIVCAISIAINEWRYDSQQRAFASYVGFLSGILIAYPIEVRFVNFNPKSSHWSLKGVRYVLSVVMVVFTLFVVGKISGHFVSRTSLPGFAIEYFRYALGGLVSMLIAPIIFTAIGLAEKHAQA